MTNEPDYVNNPQYAYSYAAQRELVKTWKDASLADALARVKRDLEAYRTGTERDSFQRAGSAQERQYGALTNYRRALEDEIAARAAR